MNTPSLTVFTIGYESADDCLAVLDDLRTQTIADQIEVAVVAADPGSVKRENYPEFLAWRYVQVDAIDTAGAAMEAAVHAASADFIVYAEEHATFAPDWCEWLLDAHQRGYDVVGFAMKNANPKTATSWAHFYGQFGNVVAPAESQELEFLAGHHVSYRTSLLRAYGENLRTVMEDESAAFLELRERGIPLYLEARAISYHVNISHFPSLAKIEFVGLRSFAASRATLHAWPLWKRLVYALASPLAPLVRGSRIVRHLQRSKRLPMLPRLLPVLVPVLALGALGEAAGYLFGRGRSSELKMPIELSRQEHVTASDRAHS